jgi:hypothetical protein
MAGTMSNKRFVFWAMLLLIAGLELMLIRYYVNTEENYTQTIINAEIEHFITVVGADKVPRLKATIDSFKAYIFGAFNQHEGLYKGIMDMVGLPFILGIIRGIILLYTIPVCIIGLILGIAEGYIGSYKKLEAFKIKSVFGFHIPLHLSFLLFFGICVGYLLSPISFSPFVVIYSFGGLSLFLAYNVSKNLPIEYL